MEQSNIYFLAMQLLATIKRVSNFPDVATISIPLLKFIIEFDTEEKQESKTNFDEIMYHWALPKKLNQQLGLEETCESLVTGRNDIPLWIKLSVEDEYLYRLRISKRFRKKNIIKEWHKENDLMPVIIVKR